MIKAIHHIALIVSSEKCLEFYKILGFQETFRLVRKFDIVVLMSCADVELELFIDNRHPKRETEEPIGLRHFALKVDDLVGIIKSFRKAGIEVGELNLDWRGQRYFYVMDFDGIVVELHE